MLCVFAVLQAVFYCAAHTGVIYDYRSRRQHLLQGHVRAHCGALLPPRFFPCRVAHLCVAVGLNALPSVRAQCNPITCCSVSEDKRWIATADAGPDSMIVIWDSATGTPIKTIFNVRACACTGGRNLGLRDSVLSGPLACPTPAASERRGRHGYLTGRHVPSHTQLRRGYAW